MEVLTLIADHAGDICQIATCAALVIRPVREWLIGTAALRDGQRCLLRSEIVRIYYRHHDDKQLREYEYKNLVQCYEAYKALGGNSFIDHIYREMQEWHLWPQGWCHLTNSPFFGGGYLRRIRGNLWQTKRTD